MHYPSKIGIDKEKKYCRTLGPGIFSSTFLLPVYGSKYSIFNSIFETQSSSTMNFFTLHMKVIAANVNFLRFVLDSV